MPATSDKDYIDARFSTIEAVVDGRLSSFQNSVDAKFAEMRTEMHKGFADIVKWAIGIAIASVAVSVAVITFVVNHASTKSAPPAQAPVVIYLQPSQPALPIPDETKRRAEGRAGS